ncbi:MAG TPA: ABC transporter substrate-binding protein [Rhodospirillaceae bacterium]|nr:ABC transporter substrate-binding protein [Rhodospirillaceae bacterium]
MTLSPAGGVLVVALLLAGLPAAAGETIAIGILAPDDAPAAAAIMGARLAIEDNNTTGRFTGHSFSLDEERLPAAADPAEAAARLAKRGSGMVVSLLDAGRLLKAAASGAILFNAAADDESLRNQDCRANILHVAADRAMLADAMAQYLVKKRWSKWLLTFGSTPGDGAFAEALRRAAKRFGARIVDERPWTFAADSKPENEVAAFTQGVDYDVVVVADEAGAFGDLLSYRLWLPRPVAGTQGLVPKGWDAQAEDWGAVQLQNRFLKLAKRPMTATDYAAWLAVRAVGEAAGRAGKGDPAALRAALLSPDFKLAGFKGRQLSFRDWDHQLRQPILLAAANGVIAAAPVEGFLHPTTDLDTLGTDSPETKCRMGGTK